MRFGDAPRVCLAGALAPAHAAHRCPSGDAQVRTTKPPSSRMLLRRGRGRGFNLFSLARSGFCRACHAEHSHGRGGANAKPLRFLLLLDRRMPLPLMFAVTPTCAYALASDGLQIGSPSITLRIFGSACFTHRSALANSGP